MSNIVDADATDAEISSHDGILRKSPERDHDLPTRLRYAKAAQNAALTRQARKLWRETMRGGITVCQTDLT